MRLFVCLAISFAFFSAAKAVSVVYLEGDDIDHALSEELLVFVKFPDSCETNCRADFVFQAKAATTISVLQDAFYDQRLIVAAEGASMETTSEFDLDVETLSLFRRTQKISVRSGSLVTLSVIGNSLRARFGLLVGERQYSFWQLTLGFAALTQSLRLWAERFYFPVIYGALCLLFFLSWPLQKRRPNTTMILSSLAMLSLLAWALESFYCYFQIANLTKKRSFFSFLLNVLLNLVFVFVLSVSAEESYWTRRVAVISVAVCSLLIGGAGAYLCPVLLLLELLFLREKSGKINSVVCKVV